MMVGIRLMCIILGFLDVTVEKVRSHGRGEDTKVVP